MLQPKLAITILLMFIGIGQVIAAPQELPIEKILVEAYTIDRTAVVEKKENPKLVVIGSVLTEGTGVKGAVIQLIDIDTREKEKFITKEDGNFFFTLVPNKKYMVRMVDDAGGMIKEESIDTTNKTVPDIIHIYLNYDLKK